MKTETLKPQTTSELYDWEVELCRLPTRPNLTWCFSLLDAFEHLKAEYPAWFVTLDQGCIRMFKHIDDATAVLVLVEKGAAE